MYYIYYIYIYIYIIYIYYIYCNIYDVIHIYIYIYIMHACMNNSKVNYSDSFKGKWDVYLLPLAGFF